MTGRGDPMAMTRRGFLAGATAAGLLACSGDDPEARPAGRRPETLRYGDHPRQVADLHLPPDGAEPAPVVVLLHGGFWRPSYDRHALGEVAEDLSGRGWAAWNLEYRPVGEGGGWPATFADVAAGIDRLSGAAGRRLDLDRVVTFGHSAGGTLALWAAARRRLPDGAPGHAPRVEVTGVVSVAGITNLVSCWFEGLGRGACEALMGPPPGRDDRYQLASPENRLPLDVPQLLVHAGADAVVPARQATAYAAKAEEAGDDVTLLRIDGADHFELVDPAHAAWGRIVEALDHLER